MTDISPKDVSLLALIAGYGMSRSQAAGLLRNMKSRKTRSIANVLVNAPSRKRPSKSDREAARAMREWARSLKVSA